MVQIGEWSSIGTIGSKYGQGYELDAVMDQLDAVSSDFNTTCEYHDRDGYDRCYS